MRVIIAGCRDYVSNKEDGRLIAEILLSVGATRIISGGAKGADRFGEFISSYMLIPLKIMPADWATHGKAAGPIRNTKMAEYARRGTLIAIWDGKSRGTKNMITTAKAYGMDVHVVEVKD